VPAQPQEALRNVELKARDTHPAQSLAVCRSLGAVDQGLVWQRDTYFAAREGRLKLREQRPGTAQLIHYERPDHVGERESVYRLTEVEDAGSLRASLERALGITVVVEKRRRLFLWQDVRIHLDEVVGLGAYIEFEAVARQGSDLAAEHRRVLQLRHAFRLAPGELIASGYSDLLLAAGGLT
jgi:adenylate cyclase class 2